MLITGACMTDRALGSKNKRPLEVLLFSTILLKARRLHLTTHIIPTSRDRNFAPSLPHSN